MADGFEKLGALLGGGLTGVRENAYKEGRLHSARTEQALASARKSQLEATTLGEQERQIAEMEDMAADSGDPLGLMVAQAVRAGGGNAHQIMQAQLAGQEYGFRKGVADVGTGNEQRHRNLQALEGKPSSNFIEMGAGEVVDATAPQQAVSLTPLGETMAAENRASEFASNEMGLLRQRTPRLGSTGAGTSPDGVKAPSGYMLNPDFDPSQPESSTNPRLRALLGGPADPNTQKPLGVRERQVISRVVNAGMNTAADLANIMRLPTGVSTGFLGTGLAATPGSSVMEATAGMLKYKLADSEVRDYQRILAGLTNQMQTMESMGMAGTESMREAYNALSLRPLDTVEDKLMALALIRQTTENGLRTVMSVSPLPDVTRDEVLRMLTVIAESVPFTPEDVIDLKLDASGSMTLAQAAAPMRAKLDAAAGAAPGAAPQAAAGPSMEQLVLEAGGATMDPQTGRIVREDGFVLYGPDAQGNYAFVGPNGEIEEVAQ